MAKPVKQQQRPVDTLRLPTEVAEAILQAREAQSRGDEGADSRASTRRRFRAETGLIVTVHQAGSSTTRNAVARYTVTPRDLSTTGVGFLHGTFLYEGTSCVVSLPATTGEWVHVPGQVMRCQHVEGKVHEIGVLFRDPIDLDQFTLVEESESDAWNSAGPKLLGRVLCVEDLADDRDLVQHMLDRLDVKAMTANNGNEAEGLLETDGKFDLVMVAHRPDGLDGIATTEALRAKGCKAPVVLLTAEVDEQVHSQAIACGCNAVLVKPFDVCGLASTLLCWLPTTPTVEDEEPTAMPSLLWADESMRPLILAYVKRLSEQVEQLGETLDNAAQADARKATCLQIKGSAGGYGYPLISHAAQQLLTLCGADEPPEELRKQFETLAALCRCAAVRK